MLYYLLCLVFLLFVTAQTQSTGDGRILSNKKRHKREWVIPSRKVTENVDYTHNPYVAKIRSDMGESLYYTLKGPGADEPPFGLFVIENKGLVRLTRPLDREEREIYTLRAIAWFNNKSIAEDNIKINITVEDQNDNPPKFIKPERGSVYEGSPAGTFVMQVVAKDEDQPGTLNSKIAYTIDKQEPNNGKFYFAIDKDNGTIFVKDPTLDREEQDSYMLTLHAADMDGSAEGNVDTTTVFIDILDINDNIPTLESNEFSASIDENVAHVEVLKIQALDADEERTDNWLAVFEIVSGNEDGRFSIETDHRTNKGVVFLNKPVDFESVSNLNLSLAVANIAPPSASLGSAARSAAGPEGSSASEQKTYLLKINVENKRDGPKFEPAVKFVSVSEDIQNNSVPGVIAMYTAIDEDTGKTAEKVKYAEGYDPDNWISVNKDTAEITLHTVPDRESPFVVNGTYYVKILCITDEMHSRTSTGTIALQVENINDICPKLTDNVKYVCSDDKVVNITAEDTDADPYGAPLEFNLIPEKTTGKWSLRKINDVSASLLTYEDLWPGYYQVTLEIKDRQGLACPDEQVLRFEVCTCSKKSLCAPQLVEVTLGEPVIVLLVLEILFLLLVLLILIKCKCGGDAFIDMPFETKACFISYNTEGIGEDKDVLLMSISPKFTGESGNEVINAPTAMVAAMNFKTLGDEIQTLSSHVIANKSPIRLGMMHKMFGGLYYDVVDMRDIPVSYQDIHYALPDAILKEYFMQKSRYISGAAYSEDKPMNYAYEGEISGTDSLSNINYSESDDDLELLNDLGPKFQTLGEVCGFRQSPSVPIGTQADPKVIVNTVMTKPATHETLDNVGSSNHVTKTVQPSHVEKSLPVQATPNDELVTPVYYTINKPISSNVVLSENLSFGHGQGVYIINRSSETEGHLQNIDHPIMCSQIAPYIPVMVRKGLGEIISIPNQNLAMVQRPMLIGSPQLVEVPEGLVVSGEYRQDRVNQYFTMSPQTLSGSSVLNGQVQNKPSL